MNSFNRSAHSPFEDSAGTAWPELDLDAQGIGRHGVEGHSVVPVDVRAVRRCAGDRLESLAVTAKQPPGIGYPTATAVAIIEPIDFHAIDRSRLGQIVLHPFLRAQVIPPRMPWNAQVVRVERLDLVVQCRRFVTPVTVRDGYLGSACDGGSGDGMGLFGIFRQPDCHRSAFAVVPSVVGNRQQVDRQPLVRFGHAHRRLATDDRDSAQQFRPMLGRQFSVRRQEHLPHGRVMVHRFDAIDDGASLQGHSTAIGRNSRMSMGTLDRHRQIQIDRVPGLPFSVQSQVTLLQRRNFDRLSVDCHGHIRHVVSPIQSAGRLRIAAPAGDSQV